MGVEKEGTKSEGGYVGGLFRLFDWTSKSRKKLFATKSDLPGSLKQRRKIDGNLSMMQPYLVGADEDEIGVGASIRSSDHSYASSVTDDDMCGTRAPSVVARLMGLDSLPSSSFHDPYSSPYFDSRSLQDVQYWRTNLNHQHGHQNLYSGKLVEKVEGSSRNFIEPKPQNNLSRPIEKFQSEVMPPKAAKTIPVTHHKLLSPIKSPGFIPTNNAAYIMEAAARIIEPSPQATTKARAHLASSSSVSLRVRDLKEKAEASQKGPLVGSTSMPPRIRDLKEKGEVSHRTSRISEPSQRSVESNSVKYLKRQSLNKSWNGSVDAPTRSSTEAKEDSSVKNAGKSISLAIQAKVNVQRREGLNSSGGRSLVDQKEDSDAKTHQPLRANVQKGLHKKPSSQNASGVLKQNNLKQNHSIEKDKQPSKQIVSNSHRRKSLMGDSGCHRSSSSKTPAKSKVGSKKSATQLTDSEKEVLYTHTNNFPRKKRSTDRDWNDRVVDNLFIDKTQRPVQSSLVSNKRHSDDEVKKKDMDVVSFTFTTPLARNNSSFETSGKSGMKTGVLPFDHHIKRVLLDTDNARSPIGYNVIGGDALGILLEQKLRELTNGLEYSCDDSSKVRPSSSTGPQSKDVVTTPDSVNFVPQLQLKRDQDLLLADKLCGSLDSAVSFTGLPELSSKHRLWGDKMEECKSNLVEPQSFNCRLPSPISVLEPSFSAETFESSFSTDATSTEGSKLSLSAQAQEVHGLNFSGKFYSAEADTELCDSACSTSTRTMMVNKEHTSTSALSTTWELDYVKEILCNVEQMYMDFASGRAHKIVNPHLFNQLESQREAGYESDGGECRIRRKVIFDCVSEYLDLRCRRSVNGGYEMWAKGTEMVRRNEWLAKEVYKEISSWRGMGDSMVDELVDKDMSQQYGRWLDFELDAFELGAEVEDQILNSLLDDVVADILQL
nr:uncharacterized protein LOC112723137 isoform X1 [Arachis hypogaea]XP_029146145.1 uncharacterized protein LOC112723137 isoform X1 [Arachis hypogaea]XP_029146146.1 uncharacterized protein LOC112723137 isoform X1 [Arachis hypogaea]XP_029146147.1 uncharacterized protein LOC112723137 isoform X1 [Arachis hypogaea]